MIRSSARLIQHGSIFGIKMIEWTRKKERFKARRPFSSLLIMDTMKNE